MNPEFARMELPTRDTPPLRVRAWDAMLQTGGLGKRELPPTPLQSQMVSFQNAAQAARARSDKSVELSGERTIRFTAPSFVDGYEKCKPLIALATAERASLLVRLLQQSEEGKKVLDQYGELLLQGWFDPEKLPEGARNKPAPARRNGSTATTEESAGGQ